MTLNQQAQQNPGRGVDSRESRSDTGVDLHATQDR